MSELKTEKIKPKTITIVGKAKAKLLKTFESKLLNYGICTEKDLDKIELQMSLEGKSLGMYSVRIESFPVVKLHTDGIYNRKINKTNVNDIAKSMATFGFFKTSEIHVNIDNRLHNKFEVFNGQHRKSSAEKVGLKKVPVIFFQFKDWNQMISVYEAANENQNSLTRNAKTHAKVFNGDPMAESIYTVYNDIRYNGLYRRVQLEKYIDINTGAPLKGLKRDIDTYYTGSQIEHMLSASVFNSKTETKSINRDQLNSRLRQTSYKNAASKANALSNLYIELVDIKNDRIIRGFFSFYVEAILQEKLDLCSSSQMKSLRNKLAKIKKKDLLECANRSTVTGSFAKAFNKGKKKENRLVIYERIA